jgi:hypothetical protein
MNKIELINVLDDVIYQKNFPRHRVFAALILPERPLARRNKPAFVTESPLASKVTSCPARTNSSVR